MNRDKAEGQIAGEAMRDAVRDQIRAGDPPEAKRTFDRLRGRGLSVEQVIEFMAAALAAEIFETLKSQKPYDRERYETALRALPTLPWERERSGTWLTKWSGNMVDTLPQLGGHCRLRTP